MEKDDIAQEIYEILQIQFNKEITESNWLQLNVFGKEIGLMPRDYLNLICLIEGKYPILVEGKDIENYEIKTFNQLVNLIYAKLNNISC